MLDRACVAQFDSDPDAQIATVTAAAIAESRNQLERARHMIANSRRLRVQTEVALAASRQALIEASRLLDR